MGRPRALLVLEDRGGRAPACVDVACEPLVGWSAHDDYSRKYPAHTVSALLLHDRAVSFGRQLARLGTPAVVIADACVCRQHCRVEPVEDGWALRDLGSTGGLWLNAGGATNGGNAVVLTPGDYFFVGGYVDRRLLYYDERAAAPPWVTPLLAPY